MTWEEMQVRTLQAAHIRLERVGLLFGGREPSARALQRRLRPDIRSLDNLLARLRSTPRPCRFFPGLDDREGTLAAIRTRYPQQEESILRKAQQIEAGRFDLLGYRDLTFGDPIDWHLDPVSNKTNELRHWSRIPFLDATRVGDHKVIWELNRHQYFVTLGQAYWLTGEERYARIFVSHITGWMDANPPCQGINWASSLEVAFRAISWLWALAFFRSSPTLTSDVCRRMLGFLYLHGRHIERYLSTFFSPNTHLTGEALGLFYLGLLLPEFRSASRWRALGQEILEQEVTRQVLEDGVYFEQATYYQRYTADFYLHFLILAEANRIPVQESTRGRVLTLLDHLMYLQRPDGLTPLIGDDDGGRLVTLADSAPNDFRATLSTAGIALGRPDYCYVAGAPSVETMWLLGPRALEQSSALAASPPPQASKGFRPGGYYVMRDGWEDRADYMVIDCGPHGSDTGGHAHADSLSFEVSARGEAILIDPGTYTYTAEPRWREYFRSSAAHNTVTVDNASSSVPTGPFRWAPVARGTIHAWRTHPRFDYFEGSHDGFTRLDPPARHRRSVFFVKGLGWIIRDVVESSTPRTIGIHFHCAPDVVSSLNSTETTLRLSGPNAGLLLAVLAQSGALRHTEGWVSPVYGKRLRAPAFAFVAPHVQADPIFTILVPSDHDPNQCDVTVLPCSGGHGFHISTPEAQFDILCGGRGHLTSAGVTTDAAWVSLKREPAGPPVELIVLDGSAIAIDGADLLAQQSALGCYVGRPTGDAWVMNSYPALDA